MEYVVDTEINAPLLTVAALLGDHEKIKLWMKELKSYKIINGTGKEVGSKAILTINVGGERKVTETVTGVSFPNKYAVKYEMDGGSLLVETRLQKMGKDRTKYSLVHKFTFGGVLKMATFLMKPAFIKRSEEMVEKFKLLAERS